MNPNTMQRALSQLETEGLLYSQRTAGRFVTQDDARIAVMKRELAQKHLRAFIESMYRLAISREEALAMLDVEYGKETKKE